MLSDLLLSLISDSSPFLSILIQDPLPVETLNRFTSIFLTVIFRFIKFLGYMVERITELQLDTVSAIGNYYADDQLTNDVESELSPLDKKQKITVKKMDVNLFNISTGNGSWIRMDKKGLESLIRDNNRLLDIIFI